MEKTVDINENSQFMEDLAMFRAGPDEHLQSFIDEASPDISQDGLGSFKFPANSNPLEQLGLYMKNDEDEEEEIQPQSIPQESNDTEEGEIDWWITITFWDKIEELTWNLSWYVDPRTL